MKKIKCILFTIVLLACISCSTKKRYSELNNLPQAKIKEVTDAITKVMVHDITNPPLASRFFAYTSLAGYEVVSQNNPAFKTMTGILNDYPEIPKPAVKDYAYQASAVFAMLETASRLQPSGILLDTITDAFTGYLKANNYSEETIKASKKYAKSIAESIIAYAKADGYREISRYSRYSPKAGDGFWSPTPPAYIAALEPQFKTVRKFYQNNTAGHIIYAPQKFSNDKNSSFSKLVNAVHKQSKALTAEQKAIADFWDCNPFAVLDQGHLQIGVKKISPGAHWMGITAIACNVRNVSFDSSLFIHTIISTAMMDAFITCWDKKYEYNRVRPETIIRKRIDESWQPVLQTPPFPEYPSGHSVISACSAALLTYFFGNQLAYTDDVELPYGLPARKFTSFNQAAAEAGISRFYGGIHFMDAVEDGLKIGKAEAENIINTMRN